MKENKWDLVFPTSEEMDLIQGGVDLVNHFYSNNLMLPANEDKWKKLADKGRLIVAVNDDKVIGTAGLTEEYSGGLLEFGSWAVGEEWQGVGVGKALLTSLLLAHSSEEVIAFGNHNSKPIFVEMGGGEIIDFSNLPEEIFEPCEKCPNKPEVGCCDEVIDLAPIIINLLSGNA